MRKNRFVLKAGVLGVCTLGWFGSVNAGVKVTQKSSGKSIVVEEAEIIGDEVKGKVKGKVYVFKLDTLTESSVKALQEEIAKASGNEEADDSLVLSEINKIIGVELFGNQGGLWEESGFEIAQRLKWPAEGADKQNASSYRLYPRSDYSFLGARPYCATLYSGMEGKGERLSLVFANKGDYGSTRGVGEDHFKTLDTGEEEPKTLNEAIELDASVIEKKLTEAIGEEAKEQRYGEKEDRRKVKRWDVGEHAFLLTSIEDEMTSLLVVSIEDADAEGKIKFVKDSVLKAELVKNVLNEENGDVRISNIPMVDQGPKGYCAPATFERAMRYMNVPADMYLLATAATSTQGTNTRLLAESCKRIVRSKARKIRDVNLNEDLSVRFVKKYIDKGVPVLWQMRSLHEYNQLANKRTLARAEVSDMAKWKQEIEAEAETVVKSLEAQEENYHICMIVGYNEETNEVAVSDSWGPRYELRWVSVEIAKAVTSYGGFVIDL